MSETVDVTSTTSNGETDSRDARASDSLIDLLVERYGHHDLRNQAHLAKRPFRVAKETQFPTLRRAWLVIPVGVRIALIYFVTRAITTLIMLAYARNQEDSWQIHAQPNYVEFANIWDAVWYKRVATEGYPTELPMDDEGHVTENSWAFMPVYPMLIRVLMVITGLGFEPLAIIVSLAAGLGAAYAFYSLARRLVDPDAAMFSVLLLGVLPTAPMFQVGYAESLHLFFLAILLILLIDRHYMTMLPVIVVASLTRPTGLAWALTLVLFFVYRWWMDRAQQERFPGSERVQLGLAVVVSIVSGFLWLIIAWIVTGSFSAYTDTEFAWRSRFTGWDAPHFPFTGWFLGLKFWMGHANDGTIPEPWAGVVEWALAILIVMAFFGLSFWLLTRPFARRLGMEVRLWCVSYLLYLFAVFFPQSSTFRLLMPLAPAVPVAAVPHSPVYRVGVVALSIVLQIRWFGMCWFVDPGDWSPP